MITNDNNDLNNINTNIFINPSNYINGTSCDDNNPQTINDIYTNDVCAGDNVEGQSCDDNDNTTINDIYHNGICTGTLKAILVPASSTIEISSLTPNSDIRENKNMISTSISTYNYTINNYNPGVTRVYLSNNSNGNYIITDTSLFLNVRYSKGYRFNGYGNIDKDYMGNILNSQGNLQIQFGSWSNWSGNAPSIYLCVSTTSNINTNNNSCTKILNQYNHPSPNPSSDITQYALQKSSDQSFLTINEASCSISSSGNNVTNYLCTY